MKETAAETFYRQRAFWGNLFVFVGILVAILDPQTHIVVARLLAGFVLASLGFVLRIWASSYVWPNIDQSQPEARSGLVTAGPYAYLRNPIYLGAMLMILGVCVTLGSWWASVTMLVPTFFMHSWHANYEESFMNRRFGQAFSDYKRMIPRFFPKLWAPYPLRQGELSWPNGIQKDTGPLSAFILFFVATGIYFIVAGHSPAVTEVLFMLVGAVLVSFVLVFVIRRLTPGADGVSKNL